MRWGTAALLGVLSTFVGCYPEFAFVGDDSGTTTTDTALGDDGVDAADARVEDDTFAATDSSAVDSALLDAAPEVETTAPTPSGCAGLSGSAFCRDFDAATTVGTGWGGTYLTGTAGLVLDTSRSHSPSKSMRASLTASSAVAAANAHQNFTASSSTRPMALDFWAWFDSVPSGDGPLVVKIARDSANRGVSLYLGSGGFAVDVNAPSGTTNHKAPGAIAPGKWIHVRFETMLSSTTTGWFKLYVDDMKSAVLTRTGIATTTVDGTDIKVNVGFYADTNTGITGWFDDIAWHWL